MIIGVLFTACAAIMIIAAVSMMIRWNEFSATAVTAYATITDIETSHYRSNGKTRTDHDVTVEYSYNGKDFNRELGYYTSGMYEGQQIEISINPDNPGEIMTSTYLAGTLLIVFALIFGALGVYLLVKELTLKKYITRLIEEDKYVICSDWTEGTSGVKVNNVRYYMAVFEYTDPIGRNYYFNSHPYHPNKCPFYHGQSVQVFVDLEENPDKYYVDSGN